MCGMLSCVGEAVVWRHEFETVGLDFWIVSLSCVGENIRHTSARCTDIGGVTCAVAESRAEMVHDVVMRWMSTVFNQHRSSVGEWGAHNPQVRGSKPRGANIYYIVIYVVRRCICVCIPCVGYFNKYYYYI